MTSSGGLVWGGDVISLDAIGPELERSAGEMNSRGHRPVLQVECFSDNTALDIDRLERAARQAGFEIIDFQLRGWPAPHAQPSTQ